MMFRGIHLLAQASESFETTEYDLPESTVGILLLLGGMLLLFGLASWTSLRDTRFLKTPWRAGLLALRATVLILLLFVLLNPRQRTQTTQIQKSRVGILVDTSLSMAYPVAEQDDVSGDSVAGDSGLELKGAVKSRAEAVQAAFVDSGLLNQLSETHAVSVYTFDSSLDGPKAVVSQGEATFVMRESNPATGASPQDQPDSDAGATRVELGGVAAKSKEELQAEWSRILQPMGAETRLGESLNQMIGDMSGRTLSGIVVLTDGRSNAGLDVETARIQAEQSDTRLVTIGVGSQRPQVNLWLAGMQSPSEVHRGDPFDIAVVVQGSGLESQAGNIQLFQQTAGGDGSDRKQVAEKSFELSENGLPAEVGFQQQLNVPGNYDYVAVAKLADGTLRELTLEDNQRRREVEVSDRKQKVLVISSGPMRDYQFVRNTLFRHSGIESDVWLQSITEENIGFVSQEAEKLLTRFPETEAELFQYDVIVAFDADWSRLSPKQQQFLNRWVDEHSGGIIFVAGEIYTSEIARTPDKFKDIAVLYPVVLNRMLVDLKVSQRADKPWPVLLTPEGKTSGFMKISDATGKADVELWNRFKGIFRSYPVKSVKDGAIVLARYGNPRASTQDGLPPYLASQFYGKGRTMFIGSAETWRLRAISPEGHQRFWTSLIREVGQGRRSRGRSRGLLLLDRTEVSPGQTVTIRAQLYDARMQPLVRESVSVSITDEQGRPVSVPDSLRADSRKPGQFFNSFRPGRPGVYRVTVPVPESSDVLQGNIEVVLPNLESENPSQDVKLLTSLTEGTGGKYLSLEEAQGQILELLPDRSEPIVIDEQLKTLWDKQWLMYLMVVLLGLEWALRRVVRLS